MHQRAVDLEDVDREALQVGKRGITGTEIVLTANTEARKPTAAQNNRSVSHHPVIRLVATTEVAQPLSMAMTQAATAVVPAGVALRDGCGIAVVAGTSRVGSGPVGARRMMPVRVSSGPASAEPVMGARLMMRVGSPEGGSGNSECGGRVTG